MASLASTAVTVLDSWTEGGPNGRRSKVLRLQIVLAAMGSVTNKVLASAMGLSLIESCSNGVKSSNGAVYATPSYDGTYLLLNDGQFPENGATTGADSGAVDITATIRITVRGY